MALWWLLIFFLISKVPATLIEPNAADFQFDWIKSIAKIKRSIGADKLLGFEIFPDPKNRSVNFLAIGSPSSESELPLWDLFWSSLKWLTLNNFLFFDRVDDTLAKKLKRVRKKSWSRYSTETEDESEHDLSEVDLALVAYAVGTMKFSCHSFANNLVNSTLGLYEGSHFRDHKGS